MSGSDGPSSSQSLIFDKREPFHKGDIFKVSSEDWPLLTPDQLVQILDVEELRPISPIKGIPGRSAALQSDVIQALQATGARKINAETFNPIFQCKSAKMSADGRYLHGPDGKPWKIGKVSIPALLVRQAYIHHWKIIQHNFDNPTTAEPIFISGTPGIGKSVEGYYLIHQLFETFEDPPIIFVPTKSQKKCIIHLYGRFYSHPNFSEFINTGIYELIVTHFCGTVWHICDTVAPNLQAGFQDLGPLVIISSPGRVQLEMKDINAVDTIELFLPLPTNDEMELLRQLLSRSDKPALNSSAVRMNERVRKYGCIPRTVFEFSKEKLDAIDKKFGAIEDVERMLNMVGGSFIDHDRASGSFFHMMPCLPQIETTAPQAPEANKLKRSGDDAGMAETGLTKTEEIKNLKSLYTNIVYVWASEYIRDLAFDRFLTLTADRMMQIVLNHQNSPGSVRSLLLEPFVHKLFTECGAIGRMKNLETDKKLGTVRLGPWKTKNIFESHSSIHQEKGVYNMPMKSNEASIDSIVPSEGYLFQITTSAHGHGINRPGIDELMKSNPFSEFNRSKGKKKNISFVWIVESHNFESYKKQSYHGSNKTAYSKDSELKEKYPGIDQFVYEIDMKRIYQFHSGLTAAKPINMTDKMDELQKRFKSAGIGSSKKEEKKKEEEEKSETSGFPKLH